MKFEVVVTPTAERDIDRLFDFLIARNPEAASRAVRLIRDGMTSLQQNPLRGRRAGPPEFRELVLRFGRRAYLVRYRVLEATVVITSVRHSLEQPRSPT